MPVAAGNGRPAVVAVLVEMPVTLTLAFATHIIASFQVQGLATQTFSKDRR